MVNLPAQGDVSRVAVGAEASPGVIHQGAEELAAVGRSGRPMGGTAGQPVSFTPGMQGDGAVAEPVTLPPFVPFSAESSPGSKLDARLRIRLARLQLDREERECCPLKQT